VHELARALRAHPTHAIFPKEASIMRLIGTVLFEQNDEWQAQVAHNNESRRRQYELVEGARRRGFRTVEVIDDDLRRSASGMVARPGAASALRAPGRGHRQ